MTARRSSEQSFLPPLWLLTVGAVALFIWLLFELKEMVVLLVVGYSIAYIIDPVLDRLERWKVSRTTGVFALIGLLIAFVALVALTALPVIVDEFQRLLTNFPSYLATAKGKILGLLETTRHRLPISMQSQIDAWASETIFPEVSGATFQGLLGGVLGALLQGYSITLTLINLLLLPFIVFYLAIDIDHYHRVALSVFPKRSQKQVIKLAREIDEHVSAFVRGQLLVGAILFVLYCIGLGAVVRVELWFLLAFISGFGNLVPYLGTIVGIVLTSIMALVTHQEISALLWVGAVFGIVQILEGFYITPRVLGEKVGLSPLAVILAIFAFGKIFGLLGVFLAIPFAGVVRVVGRYAHGWVLKQLA